MQVRFWGTRGGIPIPGPSTMRYGGNTPCVEVQCGPYRLIFDAGTGLRNLGEAMLAEPAPLEADLLFSHFHLDHVIGLGFFAPLYRHDTSLRIHAGLPIGSLRSILSTVLSAPLMPDMLGYVRASLDYAGFQPGDTFVPRPGVTIATAPLCHPGGCVGYRIEWQGKAVAYVTDTEHTPGARDPHVMRLSQDADMLIYDCSYTDAEFPGHVGWGHSTWQEAIRIANAASVRQVILFHHDPRRADADLDAIGNEVRKNRRDAVIAAEGMVLAL